MNAVDPAKETEAEIDMKRDEDKETNAEDIMPAAMVISLDELKFRLPEAVAVALIPKKCSIGIE